MLRRPKFDLHAVHLSSANRIRVCIWLDVLELVPIEPVRCDAEEREHIGACPSIHTKVDAPRVFLRMDVSEIAYDEGKDNKCLT